MKMRTLFDYILKDEESKETPVNAKPFLKWAGGKTQLLTTIEENLPKNFENTITTYIEPFIGSGAVFFHLIKKYKFNKVYISDINAELINTYNTIKNNVDDLIIELEKIRNNYISFDEIKREEYFYEIRKNFNENKNGNIKHASYFIFLNRTCFNGLYRVNSKNEFNVPFGKYTNPKICDKDNLINVSKVLKDVVIQTIDYSKTTEYANDKTFIYLDPPYRPLNLSSSFNSYSKESFNDESQKELCMFFKNMNNKGVMLMLSNSDPKNINSEDTFFDDLYSDFKIKRINATRMINSKSDKRGFITELLITNY